MTTDGHKLDVFLPEIVSGKDCGNLKLPEGYMLVDKLNSQFQELCSLMIPPAKRTADFAEYSERFVVSARQEGRYNMVLYPWLKKAVLTLNESDFSFVRTSRNLYKITAQEQERLSSAKLGVVGLSVGQSVAVTLAMERSFGTIKLADFDRLDLSNLNRLRAGVVDLGLPKVVLVAREIAEIDPYLNIELFPEGITTENLNIFIDDLDVLIDECDSLPMKIAMRKRARSRGIPVVMDTSDRGMIDIERFDLDKNKPLFHGLVDESELDHIDEQQRLSILFRLVGGQTISPDLAISFFELNQSIGTWPQLASAVALGGGLATSAVRQILLNKNVDSGRWHFDPESSWSVSPKVETTSALPVDITAKDPLAIDIELSFCGKLKIETTDTHWTFIFDASIGDALRTLFMATIKTWFSLSKPSLSLDKDASESMYRIVKKTHKTNQSDVIFLECSEEVTDFNTLMMYRIFMDACYQGSDYHLTSIHSALLGNTRSVWLGTPPPFLMLLSRKDVAQRLSALPEQNTIGTMLMGYIKRTVYYELIIHAASHVESIGAALGAAMHKNDSARFVFSDTQNLDNLVQAIAEGNLKGEKKLLGLGLNVSHDIT